MKLDLTKLQQIIKQYNSNKIDVLDDDDLTRMVYKTLLDNDIIRFTKKNQVKKNVMDKVVIGPLSIKPKFGFILGDEDIFVKDTKGYFEGDIVIALAEESKHGRSLEGKILDVYQQGNKELIVKVLENKQLEFIQEAFSEYKIILNEDEKDKINEHQVIKVKVTGVRNRKLDCVVLAVIADENDPDIKMKMVLANGQLKCLMVLANKSLKWRWYLLTA